MWFRNIFRRTRSNAAPAGDAVGDNNRFLPPQALHQLNRLQLTAGRYLRGRGAGQRPSLRHKPAHDFREHRLYVPGDDVRYVDWKASARHEHIFIRQGEQPRDITVTLLLDCSASMGWGNPPKARALRQLAAALGYTALSQGDRLLVDPLGPTGPPRLGPVSGKGQVPVLLNFLRSLSFAGDLALEDAVRDLTRRTRGGLVFLISDLLDMPDLDATLELLPSPTWDTVVLHLLHPEELQPVVRGNFQFVDAESGAVANYDVNNKALATYEEHLKQWLAELEGLCLEQNAYYTLLSSGWALAEEMIPHLRSLQVLTSL